MNARIGKVYRIHGMPMSYDKDFVTEEEDGHGYAQWLRDKQQKGVDDED